MPLLLLITFMMVSFFTSANLFQSIRNLLQVFIYVLFFILAHNFVHKKHVIWFFSVVSIIQGLSIVVVYAFGINRFTGVLADIFLFSMKNPNLAAGYIAAITAVCYGFIISNESELSAKTARIALSVIVAVNTTVILLYAGRGVLIIFCLMMLYLTWKKFGNKPVLAIIILLSALAFFSGDRIFDKITKHYDPLAFYRPQLWISGLKIMLSNPVYGVGLGNYADHFAGHNFPSASAIAQYGRYTEFAHNEFIQVGAELGFTGLILFCWLVIAIFKELDYKSYVFPGLIIVLFQSLFDFNLHLPSTVLLVILFISIDYGHDRYLVLDLNNDLRKFTAVFVLMIGVCYTLLFAGEVSGFNPVNPDYYYKSALADNDTERKIHYFEQSIKANADNYIYHRDYGLLLWAMAKTDRTKIKYAIHELKSAARLNPYDASLKFHLGKLYYDLREYKKSRDYFIKALEIEPVFVPAQYFVSECSNKLGDTPRAKAEVVRLNTMKKTVEQRINNKFFVPSNYERFLAGLSQ
jgi:tetratricopeptide (TPR) repeat protein